MAPAAEGGLGAVGPGGSAGPVALPDSDGDGFSDADERLAGSDPSSADTVRR